MRRGDAVRGDVGRSLRRIHEPASRATRRAKKVKKVSNLKEVVPVSRESGCVRFVECPGAPAGLPACGRFDKAREGFGYLINGWVPGGLGKKPRRGKIPWRHPAGSLAKPQVSCAGSSGRAKP